MFNQLSNRFTQAFKQLSGQHELSEKNIQSAIEAVHQALIEADVAIEMINPFIEQVKSSALGQAVVGSLKPDQVFKKAVHDHLIQYLKPESDRTLNLSAKSPKVILVCGLQGTGKTTSCAKLAHHLKNQHTVMLVSTDVHRPAAIDQLKVLADQIEVTCYPSDPQHTPSTLAQNALNEAKKNGTDVLIVDTAGRLHIDASLMSELQSIHQTLNPIETLFVMDSMTGQDAARSAAAFKAHLPLTGTILTKVDGDSRGGAALSARMITHTPIYFMGISERIEDGLQPFDPHRIADQMLDMGDIVGLVETVEKHVDKKTAQSMAKKIRKGIFTLDDFSQQITQMQKMGGLQNLLGKMPGAQHMSQQLAHAQPDEALKYTQAIIQSMTQQEKQHADLIKGSRKRRIATGSGTSIPQVNQVLKQFKQMQKMMKKLKGGNLKQMMQNFQPPKDSPF
ncbi:MAG: signal recognition particle protein [Legionellales bacterium]|nr:signal recognition particle protein [Legionellales bacterium]